MITDQISFTKLQHLEEDVRSLISLEILERGYRYYSNGLVYNISIDRNNHISASVQGTKVYHVSIDTDSFENSTCTCPYDDYCKHIAATYFYVYSNFSSAYVLLKQWRSHFRTPATKPTKKQDYDTIVLDLGVASLTPTEEQPIVLWYAFFEEHWKLVMEKDIYSITRVFQDHIRSMLSYCAHWRKPLKQIYTLAFYIDLLQQLEKLPRHPIWMQFYYFQHSELGRLAKHCFDEVIRTINLLSNEPISAEVRPLLTSLADRLHQTLLHRNLKEDVVWLTIYHTMWSQVLDEQEWTVAEMRKLDEQLSITDISQDQFEMLQYARVHFDLMLENDEAAQQRLHAVSTLNLMPIMPYLFNMAVQEKWTRVQSWVSWLQPLLPSLAYSEFHLAISLWQKLAEYQQDDTLLMQTLIELLPKSSTEYVQFLFNTMRYRQWVELHLLFGYSPDYVDKESLKVIEKHDIKALLPLYHQAVDRAVAEKNRESYKFAVRMLKKLRAHYKKLKQPERFEQYVELLTVKYSRLRAFKEELLRGKIL